MNKKLIAYFLYFAGFVAVAYPLYVWSGRFVFSATPFVLFDLFPAFGLLAFSTMWLHVVGGAFREWINKYLDFQQFVFWTSFVVLAALLLHPGLLLLGFTLTGGGSAYNYAPSGKEYLITIAILAWIIFISYDFLKVLHKKGYLAKYWHVIKLVSTLALFLAFFHSINLGRDLHVGSLRVVWWFYGITAALATIKVYLLQGPKAGTKA